MADAENTAHSPQNDSLDVEAIRQKYREERDRRVREAGTAQYNFAEGKFAHFDDDPYAGELPERDPVIEDLDVLVIGGGFGGLQAAASLVGAGINNFRILDVAGDFGGTWYWNRYPGVRCDVEAYIYLPFLEETGYMPSERYTGGAEILEYSKMIARHFDLYPHALFQTKVTGMTWDEAASRWIVTTDRGDRFAARFVTTQSGIFSRPQLPGIPGIETFSGTAFHTSRWDYEATGGDSSGGLHKLSDKRVGIVGTGATGLQVIPHLARDAKTVTVFQRTPTAVTVRDNGPTDPEWFKSLPQGWHQQRMESFNVLVSGGGDPGCPVDDGWARFARHQLEAVAQIPEDQRTDAAIAAAAEKADFEWNEMLRARVDSLVKDPHKAAALKAYYRTGCKRPGFSDDYLPAFNQDNVSIVDTASTGIERITENGVVVDGVEHELDCLIFATGFELGTSWRHQAGYDIVGRGGVRLSDKWEKGIRTFHGFFSHDFPNMLFMGLTQTGTTTNVPHMLQEQVKHLTYVISECNKRDITSIEATVEAEDQWLRVIAAKTELRREFQMECTPGYFNNEGKPEDTTSAIGSGMYLPSMEFFDLLAKWREQGDFEGLAVSR